MNTQQKIIEAVERLTYEDKLRVLKYLDDTGVKITEQSDGSRINLDILNKPQLELLLVYVESLVKNIPKEFEL
jgi:hypothetical protein